MYFDADDDMFWQVNNATKMTMLQNGNLGIGESDDGKLKSLLYGCSF